MAKSDQKPQMKNEMNETFKELSRQKLIILIFEKIPYKLASCKTIRVRFAPIVHASPKCPHKTKMTNDEEGSLFLPPSCI